MHKHTKKTGNSQFPTPLSRISPVLRLFRLFLICTLASRSGLCGCFAEFEADEVLFSQLAEFFRVQQTNFCFFSVCSTVFL